MDRDRATSIPLHHRSLAPGSASPGPNKQSQSSWKSKSLGPMTGAPRSGSVKPRHSSGNPYFLDDPRDPSPDVNAAAKARQPVVDQQLQARDRNASTGGWSLPQESRIDGSCQRTQSPTAWGGSPFTGETGSSQATTQIHKDASAGATKKSGGPMKETGASKDTRCSQPPSTHGRDASESSLSLVPPTSSEVATSSPAADASTISKQAFGRRRSLFSSATNNHAETSKRTHSPSETESNVTRPTSKRCKSTNPTVILSSDDDAGRHDDSDVSEYAPKKIKLLKRVGVPDDSEAGSDGDEDPPIHANPWDSHNPEPDPSEPPNLIAHLDIGRTLKRCSHADQKLVRANQERRSYKDLATMYARITKLRPITEKQIKQRLGRVIAKITNFSADEDEAIGEVKQAVEDVFEQSKWQSIAAAWAKRTGKKVGHNVLRERFGLILDGQVVLQTADDVEMEENEDILDGDEDLEEGVTDIEDIAPPEDDGAPDHMSISSGNPSFDEDEDEAEVARTRKKQKTGPAAGDGETSRTASGQQPSQAANGEGGFTPINRKVTSTAVNGNGTPRPANDGGTPAVNGNGTTSGANGDATTSAINEDEDHETANGDDSGYHAPPGSDSDGSD